MTQPGAHSGQFVVQPYTTAGNILTFVQPKAAGTVHTLVWTPGVAKFTSALSTGSVYKQRTFTAGIPTPGTEKVVLRACVRALGARRL